MADNPTTPPSANASSSPGMDAAIAALTVRLDEVMHRLHTIESRPASSGFPPPPLRRLTLMVHLRIFL